MRSGRLRHKIDIKSFTVAQSSYGESVKTWTATLSSAWCDIEYIGGEESFGGEEMPKRLSAQTAVFTLRYTTVVLDNTMRINHNSTYWNIIRMDNVGNRNREYRIYAELVK